MAFTDSFLIQTAVQVFMGARPEILIFIFAIFAHALLFKGLRLPLKPKRSDNDTQSKATSDENATQREVEVSNPFRSPEVIELEQQQATQLRKLVSEQRLDEALPPLNRTHGRPSFCTMQYSMLALRTKMKKPHDVSWTRPLRLA